MPVGARWDFNWRRPTRTPGAGPGRGGAEAGAGSGRVRGSWGGGNLGRRPRRVRGGASPPSRPDAAVHKAASSTGGRPVSRPSRTRPVVVSVSPRRRHRRRPSSVLVPSPPPPPCAPAPLPSLSPPKRPTDALAPSPRRHTPGAGREHVTWALAGPVLRDGHPRDGPPLLFVSSTHSAAGAGPRTPGRTRESTLRPRDPGPGRVDAWRSRRSALGATGVGVGVRRSEDASLSPFAPFYARSLKC